MADHWIFHTCIITSISGRVGDTVYVYRHGRQHARPYVIPRNPDTPSQRARRGAFAEAVAAWKTLSAQEKELWYAKARRLKRNGYNLFISNYLREVRARPLKAIIPRGTPFRILRHTDEYAMPGQSSQSLRYAPLTIVASRASPEQRAA